MGRAAEPREAPFELGDLRPLDELTARELLGDPARDLAIGELARQVHVLDVADRAGRGAHRL